MYLAHALSSFVTDFKALLGPQVVQFIIFLSPLLLLIILFKIFWGLWVDYIRGANFLKLQYSVIEIKLPKDTFKSPLAMELVLNAIHNTADGTWYTQYWNGETRPWYSLEIASFEGQIKFYIWTETRRKASLIGALYSQYPGIEVFESEDYSRAYQFDPKTHKVFALEFKFTNTNPAYPIKTYVDYGLDKDPKEEFKVDPMTPGLEWLGSLRPNEQVWMQMVIRAHVPKQKKLGFWIKGEDAWKAAGEKAINDLMKRDPKTKVAGEDVVQTRPDGTTSIVSKKPTLSSGEQDIIEAIARSISKPAFDVSLRSAYIAKRDVFDTPFGIGGLISNYKHYNTEHLNGFKPNGKKWIAKFDYPWQDYNNIRRTRYTNMFLQAYRRRSAFYTPYAGDSIVLNTEELATIYHFPGSVSATPGIDRVPSKKSQAPVNLPI